MSYFTKLWISPSKIRLIRRLPRILLCHLVEARIGFFSIAFTTWDTCNNTQRQWNASFCLRTRWPSMFIDIFSAVCQLMNSCSCTVSFYVQSLTTLHVFLSWNKLKLTADFYDNVSWKICCAMHEFALLKSSCVLQRDIGEVLLICYRVEPCRSI